MLTQIKIENFKCLKSLALPLKPLSLLTGLNAAGKSTTLQCILLLAQSLRSNTQTAELSLNGCLARLGTPGEVMNSGSGTVKFCVEGNGLGIEWQLEAENRTEGFAMQIKKILTDNDGDGKKEYTILDNVQMLLPVEAADEYKQILNDLRDTIFLSAVRGGTSDVFPTPENPSPINADVGIQGEFAPWWFYKFLYLDVDKNRCHPSEEASTLRRQFNAWANELFPEAEVNVQTIEKTNLLRLELRIGDAAEWVRPSNIGYGLTYAFPILVAGLLAKPNQILIIDSPEAHLHPLAQSQMGRFLATVAAAGVQVMIETHSDHVLNGVRLSVKDKIIAPDNTAIYFFNRPTKIDPEFSRVTAPMIDREGNLSEWPDGFFDQSDKDLAALAGWD